MSRAQHHEREAKFELSPDHQPDKLLQSLATAGYVINPLGTIDLTDTYLDTPSFALLRHGLSLRVRHGIAAYEVGIKALEGKRTGNTLNRLDIAFPLNGDSEPFDAETWPAAVFKAIGAVVTINPKHLQPLVAIRQTRHKAQITPQAIGDVPASWVAEWSYDEVAIGSPALGTDDRPENDAPSHKGALAPNGAASEPTSFRELEIEWLPTFRHDQDNAASNNAEKSTNGHQETDQTFDDFTLYVEQQFALTPNTMTKFQRGLDHITAQSHGNLRQLTPTMSLADAGRMIVHQQLIQILYNENGARAGKKSRYVHDMRVAIRRARAALRLCGATIPAATIAPHRKSLKQLGRVLGNVRDLDVALSNLKSFVRNQPGDAKRTFKQLRSELKARRKHARAELLTWLDSKKHRKSIEALANFCTTPITPPAPDAAKVPPLQVRHTLPSIIWTAYEAVRAYEVAFEQSEPPLLETYHALRIEAKYLRYLMEFSEHLLGRDGERLTRKLRTLQEHLGELNDAHVEDQRLAQWSDSIDASEQLHAVIASRRAELATRMVELAATVPLDSFIDIAYRRTIARALARV